MVELEAIYTNSQANLKKILFYNHNTSKDKFDIIKFADGTTKDDLKFEKSNSDLIITCHFEHNEESQNSITIKDLFKDDTNPSYIIDGIEFVNGEKLSVEQIVDIMLGK